VIESLHVWLPELPGSKGGIQTFSGHLLAAIKASNEVGNIRVMLKNDAVVPSHLSEERIQYHTAGRWPTQMRTAAFVALATTFAVKERPNLIFTVHPNFAPAAGLLKRWLNTPFWTVAHGIDVWNLAQGRISSSLLCADKILPVSSFTRARLLDQLPLDPERIVELPNTVDSGRFTIGPKPAYLLARHNLLSDQLIILTVARLAGPERYKGYDRILHALPAVRQVLPNVHYVLGGSGADRYRIERLIAELRLSDCVTLAGFVADDELADYYRLADVFAMPSKGEGFGIVYLEAMACGKPVLAGNKDGSVDALREGELGALVDPDDVNEIGATLIQLLQRTYAHPLLFQPSALRNAMLACYGPERFRERLAMLLGSFCKSPRIS
jgi:glycosyltransferase involved in cell wall biosynthesis